MQILSARGERLFQLSDQLLHIPLYTAYFFSDTLNANLFFVRAPGGSTLATGSTPFII